MGRQEAIHKSSARAVFPFQYILPQYRKFPWGATFIYETYRPSAEDHIPEAIPNAELATLMCSGGDDFGDHADIDPYWQIRYTGWACTGTNRPESAINKSNE